MSQQRDLTPERAEGIGVIRGVVCRYCRNQLRQHCVEACASEGLYRNLEPKTLDSWQRPPRLTGMAKLLEYAPITRLAWMYLAIHYSSQQACSDEDNDYGF